MVRIIDLMDCHLQIIVLYKFKNLPDDLSSKQFYGISIFRRRRTVSTRFYQVTTKVWRQQDR